MNEMVQGVATETQTPLDIPGTIALASLSAAAGGKVIVYARRGWEEPVNLYAAAVAEPATRKSQVYKAITAPLYDAEGALDEAQKQKRYETRIMRERLEELDRAARAAAAKAKATDLPNALEKAAEAARELDETPVCEAVQLITGDVTPEECSTMLAAQGGRLAIMSAEGRIYDIITGRYSGSGEPCLSPFLEGHAGDPLRVNRRNRYEVIEQPALTIGVCIQPAVLSFIAAKPRLRDQGMLARFLYSVPADLVGYRDSSPAAVADGVRADYAKHMKALVLSLAEWDKPQILTLDEPAQKILVEYLSAIEPRLRPDGDLYGIRDWAGKLAGAAVRISGLLHVAEHIQDGYVVPISEDTIRRGVKIANYYAAHAIAAFGVMSADPNLGFASDILQWLYPEGIARTTFTQRDAHRRFQHRRGQATTAEEIAAALRLLEIHGYIRTAHQTQQGSPQGGRPKAPSFEVYPSPPPDRTDRTPEIRGDLR